MVAWFKFAGVNGQYIFCLQFFCGPEYIAGHQVNVFPALVVLTVFQNGKVEGPVLLANGFKVIIVATIATYKYF